VEIAFRFSHPDNVVSLADNVDWDDIGPILVHISFLMLILNISGIIALNSEENLIARIESLRSELAQAKRLQFELTQTSQQTIFDAEESWDHPRGKADSGDVEKDRD